MDHSVEVGLALRGATGGFPNVQADFHRAGEGDEVNLRGRNEALADFGAASGDEVEDAIDRAVGLTVSSEEV